MASLSRDVLQAAVQAVTEAGGSRVKAARALGMSVSTLKSRLEMAQRIGLRIPVPTPAAQIVVDRSQRQEASSQSQLRRSYDEALKQIEKYEREIQAIARIKNKIDTAIIEPRKASGTSESVAVWVASDWHIEERVGPEVGDLNRFDLDIAQQRVDRFFQSGLRLTQLLAQDTRIDTIVLALLGDFFSNDIHEEFADLTELQPIQAIIKAQNMLASGIEFILKNFGGKLIIPCHSGNHARTTKTTRFSAENGHSLEYFAYQNLAMYFRNQPRVQFVIPDGYHSYVHVYNTVIRFHHGHAIRYAGGIGGIFIPAFKAISQWNKAKHADLDVFAHFHQSKDGGNFLSNGSLIGYNGFALSIKADYEPPKQNLFLIEKDRQRTCTWPILLS